MSVWYITGTSTGIGLSLVKELLQTGNKVAATSRNMQRLVDAVGQNKSDHFLPLEVDLTNEGSIKQSVEHTLAHFGTIDVLVNNAGHDRIGAVEEYSSDELRSLFDVNFFSAHLAIKYVLPTMRKNRSGLIMNVGSIAGLTPPFLSSMYAAAKAAMIAMTEGLAQEVKPFNIRVIPVVPGPFQTNFYSPESLLQTKELIDDYKDQHEKRKIPKDMPRLPGDPNRAAHVLIEISKLDEVPSLLFLGQPCVPRAEMKGKLIISETEKWAKYIKACDFE